MFVDFGEEAMPAILNAAKAEPEEWVRREMLYYLGQTKDAGIAKEAIKLHWSWLEPPQTENFYGLFMTLTPGRYGQGDDPSQLVEKLRKVAGKQ
jgi:hypothetical protein